MGNCNICKEIPSANSNEVKRRGEPSSLANTVINGVYIPDVEDPQQDDSDRDQTTGEGNSASSKNRSGNSIPTQHVSRVQMHGVYRQPQDVLPADLQEEEDARTLQHATHEDLIH